MISRWPQAWCKGGRTTIGIPPLMKIHEFYENIVKNAANNQPIIHTMLIEAIMSSTH